jgi:hypothetical protein
MGHDGMLARRASTLQFVFRMTGMQHAEIDAGR